MTYEDALNQVAQKRGHDSWETMERKLAVIHPKFYKEAAEIYAHFKSSSTDKEKSQEDMLGEILANYREHLFHQKHGESFYNEDTFIKSELSKFNLKSKAPYGKDT